ELVDLLPGALPDVVDVDPGPRGVRVEGEAERIAENPRVGFPALGGGRAPVITADAAIGAGEWITRGNATIAGNTENLASQDVLAASVAVLTGAEVAVDEIAAAVS